MADNVAVTAGTGTTIAADEVTEGTLGTVKVQVVKLMDGTINGTTLTKVLAASTAPAATDPALVVAVSPNSVNANGSAVSANSAPVVIASDQAAIGTKGATASGSALTVAPETIGGRAATANPTAVTDGQVVNTMHDKLGKMIVVGAIRTLKGTQNTIITASTAETTIVTAVASTFLDLYGLILANTGATTTKVDIRDTTAGSIITTIEVPTLETRGFMVPVDSAIAQTTVNTNWTAQCGSSTSSLQVTALYVKNT